MLEGKKDKKDDDIGDMVDGMKLQQNPESYKKGEYILVSHGSKNYPAVVNSWPSIRYFTNKKKSKDWWVINDICFEIEEEDVLGKIQNPEIVKCGQHRIFYVFHGNSIVLNQKFYT
ncbi:Hypothetical predicted protein [Mytilus galloprovincialis]|uniref:Uncharacterized protein n=1 Tax=Mytilus galloprovincialis TaxID=29158 RepID=A0A8B6BRT6_MYTGA|nr:Hypothetical predicted protein [Mytilus galloprovincialis]